MLSAMLVGVLLEGPVSPEASAILARAQQARADWVASCSDARYELCAELGRRQPSMIMAACVYRRSVHRSPPPTVCGGWIGKRRSPDRRVHRIPRRRARARGALARLEAVLDALDARPSVDQADARVRDEARSIALLTLADHRFERWLDSDPPGSIEDIDDYLQGVEARALSLAEAYGEIAALGNVEWSTAALARIALVHQVAVQRADWLPIPRGLRHRGYWDDNEFCDAVREAKWAWSSPIWTRVNSSYRLCAAAIREHKRVGPIAAACEVEGAMLGIEELTPPVEFVALTGQSTARLVAIPVVMEP